MLKFAFFLFLLVILFSGDAFSNDTYQLKIKIKSSSSSVVSLDYVTRENDSYKTTHLIGKIIQSSWEVVVFEVPTNFKGLKLIFSSENETNTINIEKIGLVYNNKTSSLLSKMTDITTAKNMEIVILDNKITCSTQSRQSSLRFIYYKLSPFIYTVKGIPFKNSAILLNLSSKSKFKVHVYAGSSKNIGYPYSAKNHAYKTIFKSDSIVEIRLEFSSTFDINLLRLDFEKITSPVQIKSVSFESELINRNWKGANLLNDFVVATEDNNVNLDNDFITIHPNNDYTSLVTNKEIMPDSAVNHQALIKRLLLMIISVPFIFWFNKKIFQSKKINITFLDKEY